MDAACGIEAGVGGKHGTVATQTYTLTEYTDDIEDKPFVEGEGSTLTFSFEGKAYEIDLNSKNAEKMRRAFQFYVDHARPAASPTTTTTTARARSRRTGLVGAVERDYDLAALREWAATGYRGY